MDGFCKYPSAMLSFYLVLIHKESEEEKMGGH